MTRPALPHLTSDDFDALLEHAADERVRLHLSECGDCQAQVQADRDVVLRLESLGTFAPSPLFADQVMAQVVIPDPFALRSLESARRRLFSTRRSLAAATTIAVVLVGAMSASVIWTLGNRETLAAAGSWLGGQASSWLWVAIQGSASNLMEQPWYASARGFFGSPMRLALMSAALSGIYLGSLYALRKLMALPTQGGSHAHA